MLEGLVANLLNRFLGMYVKNFDPKQLNVGIWNGDVKLRDLQLRKEALDQLHLPVNVVEGHLGQLTMSIPWSNLRGKPVRVNIEDVFVLAAPKEDASYNEKDEADRAHAVKMEKLENAELLKQRNLEGASQEEQQKHQSFTQSVTTAIIDNLQISIKRIHIRYEDAIATPGKPFALGFTLKELSAVSTDQDWRPTFIQATSETSRKLVDLKELAFYWNTNTSLFGTGKGTDVGAEAQKASHEDIIALFGKAITSGEGQQYMLRPVTGRAAVELDKTGKLDRPKIKARLLFQELGFVLDDEQYRDILMLIDLFHYFLRHQEYKKLQPKSSPKEDPRAWLRFGFKAVHNKIHERNRQWTWDYIRARRDDRVQYISLFKKQAKEEKLTSAEEETIHKIERSATYEDLRFWRSLARSQLRKENVGVKKAPQKQTWTQWAFGSKQNQEPEKEDDSTVMTDQQRKELYDAIDWDEKKAIADSVDLPRDSVKLQVESSLRTGSFTLKRDPHGKSNELVSLKFDNFTAKALQRPDSLLADLSLGGMRIYDGTTEGSLFPQIVNAKGQADSNNNTLSSPTLTKKLKDSGDNSADDALFHLVFEQNPLDDSADSSIMLKLKSIEIIYNPRFVVGVAQFLKPPETHMESIGALMETAGATVEGIRQQTRAGLEFALNEHKTVNANLDIQAPLIIIPESITEESTLCMILDAGHVAVRSQLVDKDTMRDVQSKQKKQYTEEDYKQLEGLMYDKFLLNLTSTQVLLGPGIEATKAQLYSDEDPKNLRIIDRINMDFTLEMSIIPKATDLTKTRVSGHLPVLHASISDRKYKNLMKLVDVAIPNLEKNEPPQRVDRAEKSSKEPDTSKTSKTQDLVGRSRSKSISAPARDDLVADESDEENDSQGQTKSSDTDTNLHQRNFEFRFTVDKLQGSLFRSDPEDKKEDELLVELVAEHFTLDFFMRPYDMVAEVTLKSLNIDDYIDEDPRPEFKKIVSSHGFDVKSNKELLTVKFVKVNADSPEFESTYEGIATNLDISVSTINVVVTRKTLLTLLDFIMITFTNTNQASSTNQVSDGKEDQKFDEALETPRADKIRIKADLESIALILNNDGIRLATLSLSSAEVGVFLVGSTMRISARLGNLSLLDDINEGAATDSPLRQLITIQGDELADFKYQTFDSGDKSYPGYDSEVFLRSGSIKINFMDEPFRKIIGFLVKFGRMQAIYNAARQAAANQASQIQESESKMIFDILIKTPIVVFPRAMVSDRARDVLTAYLGEIYAQNQFSQSDTESNTTSLNKISAGLRNVRLTSEFHYDKDRSEELEVIDKVDVDFNIDYAEHKEGVSRPDLEIKGTMSPINLRVTQTQLRLLMEIAQTAPTAFASDDDAVEEHVMQELPTSTTESAKKIVSTTQHTESQTKGPTHQAPELSSKNDSWIKLDFIFTAMSIGLELVLAKDDEPVGNVEAASLSKFTINETNVKVRMKSDDSLESELLINSFIIHDSRTKENNKFRKIMSLINDEVKQQFMASVTISGGKDRHLIAMLTIDSPRVIFALDYIFALQAFVNSAFPTEEPPQIEENSNDGGTDSGITTPAEQEQPISKPKSDDEAPEEGSMNMSFRINVVEAQMILIANPTINNSEAIVLGTEQVLISKQNASTLQVTKVGMFLCRMDKFETSRLRILDDFSMQMSMENRSQGKNSSLTSISIEIEPLTLRLSLRDILLALQIVNKASEANPDTSSKLEDTEPKKIQEIKSTEKRLSIAGGPATTAAKRHSKSLAPTQDDQKAQSNRTQGSVVMNREEMTATIEGIRVILIGDLHELPILDLGVKEFSADVRDWSGSMTGDTGFDTYVNVFNFSKSAWEPLIEPWQLGFHVSKEQELLSVEIYSHKAMELTITSATIALASKSAQFLSTDEDVLSKPRQSDAPYRILNYTGFDLRVWAATRRDDQGSAMKLADGEEAQWRFEDSTTMRQNLSPEGGTGIVGVMLEGSGFDSIERVPVTREGETLYNLKPKKDKILHRLLVEVHLGVDNVKYITFKSPLTVENKTHIPVEIGVFSPEEGNLLKIERIPPGEARPAPVGAAFMHSLVVRPDQGFGYAWSNERLFWRDLLKRPTRAVACKSEDDQNSPSFFFQVNAAYNKNDPMTSVYPYMKINLSAPIEIQNLLPHDFKYRIYDKNTKKDYANFLRKGGVSPVHVVELSHLLLLSVDLQDDLFKASDFAIVNATRQDDYRRESALNMKDNQGIQLNLKLHYL